MCLLKKSLYGLKQAAKNWSDLLSEFFVKSNFFALHADPCVKISKKREAFCMASTHVDDIFVLYNQKGKVLRDLLFQQIASKSKSKI